MNKRTKKIASLNEVLIKARKYCALNERTGEEVSRRLLEYGLMKGDVPAALEKLTVEGFLNERRFATAFAGGKFRMKKWGRNRIKMEMKRKGLPKELITVGLSELNEKDYRKTLDTLLTKKSVVLRRKKQDKRQMFASLVRFAIQKGYEQELVMERLSKLGLQEEM